jgi:hypothetical protein
MQNLHDLAGKSCAGICLMHSAYEFAKLAVANRPLRESSEQCSDNKSDDLSSRPRRLLQQSNTHPNHPCCKLEEACPTSRVSLTGEDIA